jgi:hypothetical protein
MSKKSLIIDFIILKKLGLIPEDLLFLHSLFNPGLYKDSNDEININNLEDKNYIKVDSSNKIHLRQKAIDLIEYLSIDSFKDFKSPKIVKKSKKKIKAEVVERINEYRNKWSGLKAGAMGDKQSCIEKLSRWMEINPEYSFEDILKAADIYLNTEGTNLTYLQRADYFIYKQDVNKDEVSRLSAFIDEIETDVNSDWTSHLN